jgi:hypothetical protein
MSLNYIFFINNDKPTPTYLTKQEWKNVVLRMNKLYPVSEIQLSTLGLLHKFSQAAKHSMDLALKILQESTINESQNTTTMITRLLNNMYVFKSSESLNT